MVVQGTIKHPNYIKKKRSEKVRMRDKTASFLTKQERRFEMEKKPTNLKWAKIASLE